MTAAPKLLAGLIPVPVMGMVARCTMNTANPIGKGANTFKKRNKNKKSATVQPSAKKKRWKEEEEEKGGALTGTWESRAERLGSVAEKTV